MPPATNHIYGKLTLTAIYILIKYINIQRYNKLSRGIHYSVNEPKLTAWWNSWIPPYLMTHNDACVCVCGHIAGMSVCVPVSLCVDILLVWVCMWDYVCGHIAGMSVRVRLCVWSYCWYECACEIVCVVVLLVWVCARVCVWDCVWNLFAIYIYLFVSAIISSHKTLNRWQDERLYIIYYEYICTLCVAWLQQLDTQLETDTRTESSHGGEGTTQHWVLTVWHRGTGFSSRCPEEPGSPHAALRNQVVLKPLWGTRFSRCSWRFRQSTLRNHTVVPFWWVVIK